MATAEQTYTSGELRVEWDDTKRTREYTVDTAVEDAATAACPAKGTQVDGYWVTESAAKRVGENRCLVTLELAVNKPSSGGEIPPREVGEVQVAFDTSARTEHIVRALAQTKYGGANDINVGNLIGVTDDDVTGTDIYVPTFTYNETHFMADAAITTAYINTLYGLTAAINDDTWRIFDEAECLLLGVRGRKETTDRWEVAFSFLGSRTKDISVEVDGTPMAIPKKGWQYIWFRYKKAVAAKKLTYSVRSAFVADVFESADFTDLNIGS